MKRYLNRFALVLLALGVILGIGLTAFAADSTVIFESARRGFKAQPGSEYTATDLFDNFKDVMPGDRLTETVTIRNDASDCDYITLYMKAIPHDRRNALSQTVAETETIASMEDFLAQMTMRIYNGNELIYEASPNETDGLTNFVRLGKLNKGESMKLRVELDVPVEMDNEYADRVGEVDWVFLAECVEFKKLTVHKIWEDCKDPHRPKSVTVYLLRNGKKVDKVELNARNHWSHTWDNLSNRGHWTVVEAVPHGYEAFYKTDDNRVFILNKLKDRPERPDHNGPCDPYDLTVQKVWADKNDRFDIRPKSVTVTLYNGDQAVDKVTLCEKNNWTYHWKHLDGDGEWSVLETGVPKGYVPSYKYQDNRVIITNTATLIQTGQLNWPILVLGGLGVLMVLAGVVILCRKRKPEDA